MRPDTRSGDLSLHDVSVSRPSVWRIPWVQPNPGVHPRAERVGCNDLLGGTVLFAGHCPAHSRGEQPYAECGAPCVDNGYGAPPCWLPLETNQTGACMTRQ